MRKLACFAVGFTAAAAGAVYFLPAGTFLPLGVLCMCLALVIRVLGKGCWRRAFLVLCGVWIGLLYLAVFDYTHMLPAAELDDKTIQLQGVVAQWPRKTEYGWQVDVRMGVERGVKLTVRLTCDEQGEHLVPGDRIRTVAHCTAVRDRTGATDLTYASQGIFLRARAYGELNVERPDQIPFSVLPVYWSGQLKQSISLGFSAETAPLIKAVVTGDRTDCSDILDSTIRRTGLSHTTAVSGMHLSYLIGFLVLFLGGGRSKCLITIPVILLVVVMAGCTHSITRAAVMLILVQLAPVFGRETDGPTSLATALMVLLVDDPYSVAGVGLQLSFASMTGLLLFSEPVRDRVLGWLCPDKEEEGVLYSVWRRGAWLVAGSLGATLSTMLLTTPLIAVYFGQFTLVAPLANLLVIWAVSVVFCGGLILGALWTVLPVLCAWAAPVVEWAARYVLWTTQRLAQLPFASVPSREPFYLLWVLFVYALIALVLLLPGRKRIWPALAATLCGFLLSVLLTNLSFYQGSMGVWVLDVGQGQSVLVRMEDELVLVDCGGEGADNAGDTAADLLQSLGRSSLDLLVVSHCHSDHANGVPRLLERLRVDTVMLPFREPDSSLREEIIAAAYRQGSRVWLVEEDVCIAVGDGQVQVFAPLGDETENELGLSVLCTVQQQDVLLTGDMGQETEQELLDHVDLPDVEVMVAGHHGSKYSNSQRLLEKVRPDIAVFSSGRYNTYGHPSAEAMERFRAVGAQLYRTDRMGTVRITAGEFAG